MNEVIWIEHGHERIKSFFNLADAIDYASSVNDRLGVIATVYSRGTLARVGSWLQEVKAIRRART